MKQTIAPVWQIITSTAHDQAALDAFSLQSHRGQAGTHSQSAAALLEALQGKADVYLPADRVSLLGMV